MQSVISAVYAKFCDQSFLTRISLRRIGVSYLIPGAVFALNTSESKAIKCIPYNVVFGRPAVLPQDVLVGVSEKIQLRNATTAAQYAEDLNFGL